MLGGGAMRLSSVCAVLLCPLIAAPQQSGGPPTRTPVTELKTRLLPAGPGKKPFDVTRHTVPLQEIQTGGPARDAIPALVSSKFLTASQADRMLQSSERVLGVFLHGEAKAYPVRILNWHELVNDSVGGRPILVSW